MAPKTTIPKTVQKKSAAKPKDNRHLPRGEPQEPPLAPKHPPGRKVGESRVATRTTYQDAVFPTQEAWTFYSRHAGRKFIVERGVDKEEAETMYVTLYKWTQLVKVDVIPNFSAVQEFYANMTQPLGDVVYVRGKNIDMSVENLRVILALPKVETDHEEALKALHGNNMEALVEAVNSSLCDDELRSQVKWQMDADKVPISIKERYLDDQVRVWHRFISSTIMPTQYIQIVTWEQALILYAMRSRTPVNIAAIIYAQMKRCVHDYRVRSWFFPVLITEILQQADVEFYPSDVWGKLMRPWSIKQLAKGELPPPEEEPESSTPSMRQRDFNRQQKFLLDSMHKGFQRMEDFMRHIHASQTCPDDHCTLPDGHIAHPFDGMDP